MMGAAQAAPVGSGGLESDTEASVHRSAFIANPDGLLVVDGDGRIVLANSAAAALLGYSETELQVMNVDSLVPDNIRPRHGAHRAAYALAPRPRPMGTQMDLVAKRRDGSEVMVEIALSPLQGQGLPLVVASIRDISAYPRVQKALEQARFSRYLADLGQLAVDARDPQELLNQVPRIAAEALRTDVAMVFLLDGDRQTMRVVSGVGMVPGEEIGGHLPFRPESSPGLVVSQGIPLVVDDYRTEQRFVVPQAYLDAGLVSALAVPVSDRGRSIGALVVRTRDARRFGEAETRFLGSLASLLATRLQRSQSEEALSHAQRLESVGQLTGGIAHDFNNLLTVIEGNLQVLQELPALVRDEAGQRLVAAAARASRRGAELTRKLLAFSRRQVLQPTPLDVGALLHSLADMLRRTLDQRIVINVDVPAHPLMVEADAGQLEASLLNIAINARDAMPTGGSLWISAMFCPSLPDKVMSELHAEGQAAGAFITIEVSDSGVGMPDSVRERVFEPFFTTKDPGRGTGLGLSTVYGFVKQSRGSIVVSSTLGVGTTLVLYLPEAGATVASVAEEPGPVSVSLDAGVNVLLVEDDPEVRLVMLAYLDSLKCSTVSASSGEQALVVLATQGPFDLLLTDIALGPGMRGTQLAACVREQSPAMAILLMSGYSAELLEADRDSPPDWELLRKPFSRKELAQAMAKLIAGRSAASDGPG